MSIIIGVDLDEVVAQYVAGIREFMAKRNNVPEDQIPVLYPEIDTYEFTNWGEEFVANYREYHGEAVEAGIYATLKAYEYASEMLWKLSDEGYHIRIVTSRFVRKNQHSYVMWTTGQFLDDNNIPFRDIAFTALKTEIYADVYLDDAPKNIKAFQEQGSDYIIFDKAYNREFEGDRVNNWIECYNLIKEKYPLV